MARLAESLAGERGNPLLETPDPDFRAAWSALFDVADAVLVWVGEGGNPAVQFAAVRKAYAVYDAAAMRATGYPPPDDVVGGEAVS